MAVTAASLIARYPEFTAAVSEYPNMVNACIAEAELVVDSVIWGDKADAGVKALAAHKIAINPLGELARFEKKGSTTTIYWNDYEALKKTLGLGFPRVI